jgi:putative transposase
MLRLIWSVLIWLRGFIQSRHDLGLEIVALRQQLVVLKPRTGRVHLRRSDRLFWVLLRRVWPKWSNPLLIVKPDTVVRWHRKGFRLCWRFRSRSERVVGRPVTGHEVRASLETMANENPTWGGPRVHERGVEARIRDFRAKRLHRRDGAAHLW